MLLFILSQVFDLRIEQSRVEVEIVGQGSDKVKVDAKTYGYEENAKEYYKYKITENTKFTIPQTSKLRIKVIGNITCTHSAVVLNKCEGDFPKIKIYGVIDSLDIECKLCLIEFNLTVNEGRALIDNGIVRGDFKANNNFNWTFMNANGDFRNYFGSGKIINRDGYIKLRTNGSLKVVYSKDLGDFKVYGKNIKCFACQGEMGSSDKVLYVEQSNGSFEVSR
ncbi:MAG: hypothetical protein ABIL45_00320 [candidate division WOR-3 bacterium]